MSTLKKGKWMKLRSLFEKGIHFLYKWVEPRSGNEDAARREFILNTLLLGALTLSFVSSGVVLADYISLRDSFHDGSLFVVPCAFIFFFALYLLSRKGFSVYVSYAFAGAYFLLATYTVYSWGIDIPQGLLVFVLIIVMSGILVSTRFAAIVTASTSAVILLLGYLQNNFITHPNLYWKREMLKMEDAIVIVITFCIVALVSWLSNREIEKSLFRARSAERDLRKERDSLEVKVKERTSELERAQFEKTEQMHRFVEFGRAASGIFHDMVNPVQAAIFSLGNLEQVALQSGNADLKNYAEEAVAQMEKAKSFINTARNQITRQEININFDPDEQIALVFQMLSFRAKREKVSLVYAPPATRSIMTGNPLSFHRLIAGLVSNAIDAYEGVATKNGRPRTVTVTSEKQAGMLEFSVADSGKGISAENQKKIFEVFFTTKGIEKGTGIGLAICKEIAEKEFGGALRFASKEGEGSTFIAELPI